MNQQTKWNRIYNFQFVELPFEKGRCEVMVIETERLILRPFSENDAADVLEYLSELEVNCFTCMKLNSLEEAKSEMKKRTNETEYYFAIVLKHTGKVIGEIDAYPEQAEPTIKMAIYLLILSARVGC